MLDKKGFGGIEDGCFGIGIAHGQKLKQWFQTFVLIYPNVNPLVHISGLKQHTNSDKYADNIEVQSSSQESSISSVFQTGSIGYNRNPPMQEDPLQGPSKPCWITETRPVTPTDNPVFLKKEVGHWGGHWGVDHPHRHLQQSHQTQNHRMHLGRCAPHDKTFWTTLFVPRPPPACLHLYWK